MKTITKIFFLICLFFSSFTSAQHIYNDTYDLFSLSSGYEAVIEGTPDGGFIFVNNIETQNYDEVPFIIGKKAADGNTDWLEMYDPMPDSDASFYPVAITKEVVEDTYIHAGYMFLPDGTKKMYVQKIDDGGHQYWFHTYDCYVVLPVLDDDEIIVDLLCEDWEFSSIGVNESGIIAGVGTVTEQYGPTSMFVFYIDAVNGGLISSKLLGSGDETFPSGAVAVKGFETDFFILGYSAHYNPNNEYNQPVVMRLDAQMNVLWRKIYSDITPAQNLFTLMPYNMVITSSGNCIIQGIRNREFSYGLNEIYLIALAPNGNHLWDNTFSVHSNNGDSGFLDAYMTIDHSDNLYIGFNQSLLFDDNGSTVYKWNPGLIKTNAGGAPQWYKTMIDSDWDLRTSGIAFTDENGDFAIGMIGQDSSNPNNADELWISRFSAATGDNGCIGQDMNVISKNIEYFSLDYIQDEKTLKLPMNELGAFYYTPNNVTKRCGVLLLD